MYVYMEISQDRLELPLAVADGPTELARICGTTKHNVLSSIYHNRRRFIKVEVEDEDED